MKSSVGSLAVCSLVAVSSLGILVLAGCGDKADSTSPNSAGRQSSANMSGGMNRGPGGMMGGPGGRMGGAPIAENATGEDIYQAKCGCHGPGGKGGKAPILTGGAGKSEEELAKIIHDGKGKMPAFGSQLSDDQIKKVAATVKGFS
jgi:mono/diheme cytochrome c family protein